MSFPKQIINKIYYLNFLFYLTQKVNIKKFKLKIKKTLKIKRNYNIIILGRARTGIYLSVKKIIQNKKNNTILIAPYTIPDVINMIKIAGGNPEFLDFERKSTSLDINFLKKKLRSKPAALIITHYSVNEKNYEQIFKLCKKYKVKIIEDSAISIGGYSGKKKIPINSLSDFSIFSFSAFKFLNFFYGGLLAIKNKKDFNLINKEVINWKKLDNYSYFKKFLEVLFFQFFTNKIIFNFLTVKIYKIRNYLGFNKSSKKYTNYKIGKIDKTYFTKPSNLFYQEISNKMKFFKINQSHRRKISNIYYNYLKHMSIPHDITLNQINNSSAIHYLIYHKHSDKIKRRLLNNNFDVGKIFYENCSFLFGKRKFKKNNNIDDLVKNIILLPTHEFITPVYAEKLSKKILNCENDLR